MSSAFKKIVGIAAPVIGTILAPGLGTVIGGALGGAATGGLKGAAIGGALGGIGAGLSGALGSAASTASNAATSGASTLGSSLKSGLGSALGSFAPKQALSGAITGTLGGLASGGDLSDALKGGALGGTFGGYGSALSGSLGLEGAGAQGFEKALTGASGGLATGDLTNAAIGAGLSGGSAYLKAGGSVPGFGSVAGAPLQGNLQGPTQGTGALGQASRILPLSTGTLGIPEEEKMKLGSLLGAGGDIYGYAQGRADLQDLEGLYSQASQQAQNLYNPYYQSGQAALGNLQQPNMEALQSSPEYQFALQQGNQALDRSLAARGLSQSGAALKAAQEYGQGLANQTYNDYFQRQYNLANQGFNAAGGIGSALGQGVSDIGAARASLINNRNQALSNLLGGEDNRGSLGRLLGGFL